MANKDAPFGMKPIGKVGQNRDNQGLSEYDIAASATAIYFQDPVKMLNTGTIGVAAAGDALLGVLTGIFFTDASTSKPTFANHLDASNAATDIKGFITDDPYERFEIQSNNSGASASTDIFNVADIVYAAGSSPDYVSQVELNDSTLAAGSSATLQILGPSKDPDNSDVGSANVNWVVRINEHLLDMNVNGV
jgi:hypothetical protein|tara:strand:+ start:287 stop:862 length:576 start_codon:yes stop_codon:yes gene_type:complete